MIAALGFRVVRRKHHVVPQGHVLGTSDGAAAAACAFGLTESLCFNGFCSKKTAASAAQRCQNVEHTALHGTTGTGYARQITLCGIEGLRNPNPNPNTQNQNIFKQTNRTKFGESEKRNPRRLPGTLGLGGIKSIR